MKKFKRYLKTVLGLSIHNSNLIKMIEKQLNGKYGFEIGGPSKFFLKGGRLPMYQILSKVDNCNFSEDTVWEGEINGGNTFLPDKNLSVGEQYILNASVLEGIESDKYDVVISCHVIEHLANPLKALREWGRVLKPGGCLVLVIPHKHYTFDHKRQVTTLDHLLSDLDDEMGEDDMTHAQEVLDLHDLNMDAGLLTFEELSRRVTENYTNRCMHHHVFDEELVFKMLDVADYREIEMEFLPPCHIVAFAKVCSV